jgi:hypothetical protein
MKGIVHRTGLLALQMLMLLSVCGQGPECVFVHFDKSFYVSGETIWFKVYKLDTTNLAQSKVLHVDLVNHENQTIAKQKLKLANGASAGSITLPVDSKEGYYRFRAFTRYNLNFDPPIIYSANIPIYSVGNEWDQTNSYQTLGSSTPETEDIKVHTNKKIYKPRDSITISFEVINPHSTGNDDYSISVVPVGLLNPKLNLLECPEVDPPGDGLRLPEKSLLVQGELRDPISKEKVSSRLLSVYSEKTSQLIRASASNGKLRVAVPDYWGKGVFQILNIDPFNPAIMELVPSDEFDAQDPYFNPTAPKRTSRVANYVNKFIKRKKTQELFNLYNHSHVEEPIIEIRMPDATYQTKDFTRIYSFEQFINQAINNVKVRVINNEKSVRLFNRDMGKLFVDHPWYLVDGFLTFNESEVLKIPYQDITEVKLYSRTSTLTKYFHGFMLRSGVMEITTRDIKYVRQLKESPNVLEVEGFASSQEFSHSLAHSEDERIPDFRGLMFWSPDVYTNADRKGQTTFQLSDDTGKYAIIVVGRNNQHQIIAGYGNFEIQLE